MDTLDLKRLDQELAGTAFAGKLHHFRSVDSTQNLALSAAHAGVQAGQVYIADEQTAGRGRGGHTWHSTPEDGLYLTVLVRPTLAATGPLLISLAAGLAVQCAIERVSGLRIDLRWPNDLVTLGPHSRKLGGILTETSIGAAGMLRHAAIGIGINLNQAAMPPGLREAATSILIETGASTQREPLAAALLKNLSTELSALEEGGGEVLERFGGASTWVWGKSVQVAEDGGYTGVTAGLTATGLLKVYCDDESHREVRHGGVRERC